MFGPIFVCSCCHVKHYESNVNKVDDNLEAKLLDKYPDCYLECVREFVKVEINEDENYYLCKTCITYMKSGKIPPMSVCNGLDILQSNDPELQLSELENNLIALRIMFQKIYYLPKSSCFQAPKAVILDHLIELYPTHCTLTLEEFCLISCK